MLLFLYDHVFLTNNFGKNFLEEGEYVIPWVDRLMSYTIFVGPEMIQEMDEMMQSIWSWMKEAKDQPKGFVDAH